MLKMRSTFFCSLCDQENHLYVNIDKKLLGMGTSSCQALSQETITFAIVMNVNILPWLLKFLARLPEFMDGTPMEVATVKNHADIKGVVKTCGSGFI